MLPFRASDLTVSLSLSSLVAQIFLLLFLAHLALVGWVAFTYGVDALQVSPHFDPRIMWKLNVNTVEFFLIQLHINLG